MMELPGISFVSFLNKNVKDDEYAKSKNDEAV